MQRIDTKIWKFNTEVDENNVDIKEIAKLLQEGKVIAFPTETVYGLGANALDTKAVKNIFIAKGRPSDNPLIVHISTLEQLYPLVDHVNELSLKLIKHFWPGPLTIIFKRKAIVPDIVTAGLDTVAVRMPNHPIARTIISAANLPIAAPSANRSGKPSPTTAKHVIHDLQGLIDGIVDGGPTGVGVESTIIDVSGDIPMVLRPGGITVEELKELLGTVLIDPAILTEGDKPRAPGMKYRHYAPKAEMVIVNGKKDLVIEQMMNIAKEKSLLNKKVGILTLQEHEVLFNQKNFTLAYGTKGNLYPLATHLYDTLRIFDLKKIDYIIVEGVEEVGIGLTIMNRLKKAANGNIIYLS